MHIAILVTNTDHSDFAKAHPGDGAKFSTLLAAIRPDWQFSIYDVTTGQFPPDAAQFDGWLITGSPASVHDKVAWIGDLFALIRRIVTKGTPLFGACFGHQAIAMALGGVVADNPGGWVLGLTETQMDHHAVSIYAAHKEQVVQLPKGATIIGGNATCKIGSFAIGTAVLATQYHPEMTADFIAALTEELAERLPAKVINRARASLQKKPNTAWMAQRIAQFFAPDQD